MAMDIFSDISTKLKAFLRVDSVANASPSFQAVSVLFHVFTLLLTVIFFGFFVNC